MPAILKREFVPVLLGLDGLPLVAKHEVPFIRWLPDGKSVGHTIDRGRQIFDLAEQFIARGGRYACVLDDGEALFVAGFPVKDGAKGEMIVVAEQRVPNGREIEAAIDRLVRHSVRDMHRVPAQSH